MPDSAAEPTETTETQESPLSRPELAEELSRARQHPRFLYWMSVPGQQELRTRLETPPPPKGPLLIFFLGVPLAILGVFIHASVALVAIFIVAIAFITSLFKARERMLAAVDQTTLEPAVAKVERVEAANAPRAPRGDEKPGKTRPAARPLLVILGLGVAVLLLLPWLRASVVFTAIVGFALAIFAIIVLAVAVGLIALVGSLVLKALGMGARVGWASKAKAARPGRLVCAFQPESPTEQWQGLRVREEGERSLLELPWDPRMAALESGDRVVFVAHAGRVLAIEGVSARG